MKFLVAISSCEAYETSGMNKPMRETWLPDVAPAGMDYKFFHGKGSTAKEDVVIVDCDDSYKGLIDKFRAKIKWSVDHDYDFVFVCLADCYVRPERLVASCSHTYFGSVYTHETFGSYCQGGAGFILSKEACSILTKDTQPLRHRDGTTGDMWSEDAWAGQALLRSGIIPEHSEDFKVWMPHGRPLKHNSIITCHLSYVEGDMGYKPERMYLVHRDWLESLKDTVSITPNVVTVPETKRLRWIRRG